MNSTIVDLSASGWCDEVREVFRHSPTAFSDFARQPIMTLQELGFDDEVTLSDGAKAKVSSLLASLSALEMNQVVEAVRPVTYRAGDGGGGDGGGCGAGDCGDTGNTGDTSGGIASAVAIASNVAVVGEVAVAIAAVAVAVYGGAIETSDCSIMLSPLMGVELSDGFAESDAYKYLAQEGLSDSRKRALIKQRLIATKAKQGRVEAEVLGKQAWFDIACEGSTVRVLSGGML